MTDDTTTVTPDGDMQSPERLISGSLADLVADELAEQELGVHVELATTFDPEWFIARFAAEIEYATGILMAGIEGMDLDQLQDRTSGTPVEVTDDVSVGVKWRNEDQTEFSWSDHEVPERIVALVRGDPAKLGSLENLVPVPIGQVRSQIAARMQSISPFNANVPAGRVWQAIAGDIGNQFDLLSIAEYAHVVASKSGQSKIEALGTELHHLGLFPDGGFLDDPEAIAERLEANAELVDRVVNITGTDERRLSRSIRQADSDAERRTRANTVRQIREIHRGNQQVLEDLTFSAVDELLTTTLGGGGGGSQATRTDPSSFALESVLNGEEDALRSHAERFAEEYNDAIEDGEMSVSVGIGDNQELYERDGVDDDVFMFINHFVGAGKYGGIVYDAESLPDAVEGFNALDTHVYDIHAEDTRFDDLRRFASQNDEFASTVEALDAYDEARTTLAGSVDRLYSAPLFHLLADPALLENAQAYIDAYAEAESKVDTKYQELKRQAGAGATTLLSEFLLLDTIAVDFTDAQNDYQLVFTPLHPLHLWKYVSLAQRIRDEQDSLDDLDREFLASAVEDQPHVLRSLDIGNNEQLPSAHLVQDSELGSLPVYVPAEQAAMGTNDAIWTHLAEKFLTAHPHSDRRLRISVVDPIRPGKLLDYILDAADDGLVAGCDIDFVFIETDRESILRGAKNRDDIIETFAAESAERPYWVNVAEYDSYQDYLVELEDDPRHFILINDHSAPTIHEFERDKNVTVHPLYVPKVFKYNAFDDEIEMHSSPEGGIFSKYQNLVNNLGTKYNDVHNASVHRLGIDGDTISEFLTHGVWVTVSAPATNLDTFPSGNLIAREHRGDRDYGIYTNDREYFTRALERLFNEYPLDIDLEAVESLVADIVEYERSGLLRLITEETESSERSRNAKGIIGAILAVQWIEDEIPDPKLILSIDDPVTRRWLNLGDGNERADFLVVHFEGDSLAFEIIEVKALDDPDNQFEIDSTTSPPTAGGPAVEEQLLPTTETIRGIFTDEEEEDLTTGPRKAALREQIYYELMASQTAGGKAEWVDRINAVFNDGTQPEVNPRVVSVEITNSARSPTRVSALTDPGSQRITVNQLPRPVLHQLVTGSLPDAEPAEDEETPAEEAPTEAVAGEDTESESTPDSESTSDTTDADTEETDEVHEEATTPTERGFGDPESYAEDVEQLKRVLADLGVTVREIDPEKVEVGPNIIRFKIKLGPSEKQSSIESRSEDIARQMAFEREPIIHRLPGTEYIALDVPRPDRQQVDFRDYRDHLAPSDEVAVNSLPYLAGVTPAGELYESDLRDAPHLLVGGSTGSGKTVFLYGLIQSLLERKDSDALQLALIDPKQTDFIYFNQLPNLINDHVITDATEAQEFFHWVVNEEIPRRKAQLQDKIARDIGEYNDLVEPGNEMTPLVIVVDEYADLLQQLGGDADVTEDDVRTIAQVARSLGIHLVIATQRPSHNAIDTDLRANLDVRAAFRLPKQSDSRILLDEGGAEELAGNGDMLFKEVDHVTRLQGLFVSSDELRDLVKRYSA